METTCRGSSMSREAMQMALDMLNEIADDVYCDQKLEGVIAVLRQALVDADDISQKRVDEMVKLEHDKQIEIAQAYERGWNAALAQQEPVAWITNGGKGELWWYRSSKFDEEGNVIGPDPDDIPLYAAPPKKQWVGLTDEEINSVCYKRDWTAHWTDTTFARAIEAKLREKNHG